MGGVITWACGNIFLLHACIEIFLEGGGGGDSYMLLL
jgi:hypothetical protein